MTNVEKVAYLKGLVAGLGVEPASRDGKLWDALTDLLSDMAHEIEDLQASSLEFAESLDDLNEDMSFLNMTLDLTDDYDEDDEDFDPDDYIPDLRLYEAEDEEEPEDEDEEEDLGVLYDVTCPACGEEITFDEETLEQGSITCPACGETLEFDLGDDE